MKPYEELPRSVTFGGRYYRLDLSYGTFYRVVDLMADTGLLDVVKVKAALDLLVVGKHPDDPGLLQSIYDLIKPDRPATRGEKYLDIEQDWGYICAAFQQAYGIDLYTDKDMHVLRFIALLNGIPGNTKLAEIIQIRAQEIPQPNKHNGKQIEALMRAKAQYALRSTTSIDEGWGRIFNLLKARAEKNANSR